MLKTRLLYGILVLFAVLFVHSYSGMVPNLIFNLLWVLPAVSFLYTLFVYFKFRFVQSIDKTTFTKGDRMRLTFSLGSDDYLLYPYLKITFFGSDTVFSDQLSSKIFSLYPREVKSFTVDLECKYRGFYKVGIESVEIRDFLGIFRLRNKYSEEKTITVFPRIVVLEKFRLRTNFMSETQTVLDNKYEDMATISDIRKYAYGDSFKKIHWKLTAKSNELMVKNFQGTSETGTVLLLDLQKLPFSEDIRIVVEDKLIEAMVAVVYYCLSGWIPTNIIYFEEKLLDIKAKNPLDFNSVYRLLSRVRFNEETKAGDLLELYLNEHITRANIVIFTSVVDYHLFDQIYKAKYSGYEVILVYVSPEELTGMKDETAENVLSYLPEIGVDYYKINVSDDIKAVFENR